MKKKIAVIIVTYHCAKYLRECLGSVLSELKAFSPYLIYIVDNASSDDTIRMVREQFPEVAVVVNEKNVGFAKAANQGIRRALEVGCDFVLLLNPDTKMEKGALQKMMKILEKDRKRAVVQPLLTLMSDPGKINTWGNEYRGFGLVTVGGCGSMINGQWSMVDRQIEYASGACMLITSDVLKKVGLLDERFFLSFEDTEFSERVRKAGYEIWLSADARVQHDYHRPLKPRKLWHFLSGWYLFNFPSPTPSS